MVRNSYEERKAKRIRSRVSLRAKRVDLNLTLEEASKLIGISKYTLYNYEHFRSLPNVEVAKEIARAYRVRLDELKFAPDDTVVVSSKKM